MKTLYITILSAVAFACSNQAGEHTTPEQIANSETMVVQSDKDLDALFSRYVDIKNALAKDDSEASAEAALTFVKTVEGIDTTSLSTEALSMFNSVKPDLIENAEHINKKSDDIKHQRGHFKMLSEDIYDLLKVSVADQTYYKDYCPMALDQKGAFWISESKVINNPYMGSEMQTCGEVKEEIKKP